MPESCWDRELYLRAARFACEAHAEQHIKDSPANYSLHLSSVSMEVLAAWHMMPDFDISIAMPVAWLHDTLEDTATTEDALRLQFGEPVLKCVRALTKDASLPYETRMPDVLKRLQAAPREASIVKLADRITNLQKPPRSWSKEKCAHYLEEAKVIRTAVGGAHETLRERLDQKIAAYVEYLSV